MANIVVIDDEKSIRLTTTAFLEAAGHGVRTAANRAEAMALVDEHDFDVAIVDILLGPDNGVDVAKAIRDQNPEGLPAGDFLDQADPAQLREWVGVDA